MHWNYRVCKEIDKGGYVIYSIREVYYNDKDNVTSVTSDIYGMSIHVYEDTDEEDPPLKRLEQDLKFMTKALSKPVLELDGFKFAED